MILDVFAPSLASAAEPSTAALLAEMRKSFTLEGKPIPPEILRDFGDGDLADSGGVWVTVDAKAAVDSNLYADEIKIGGGGWVSQTKAATPPDSAQVTDYTYCGATENGLLIVLSSYRGGGTGVFYTLHILDLAPGQAFDYDGKIYDQIRLTNLRNVILGDRWDGEVTISKNEITVVTTRGPEIESGERRPMTIEAKRP
jgi:hypothetical protein